MHLFQFFVEHPDKVVQYEHAQIKVRVDGATLPDELYIRKKDQLYKMNADKRDQFSYTFKNISEAFDFNVESGNYVSIPYTVNIIPKPTLLDAQVELQFPAYTGRTPDVARNVGEITVPVGTRATWKFNAKNTSQLSILNAKGENIILEGKNGYFDHQERLYKNKQMTYYLSNDQLKAADSVKYSIQIIPDRYPTISAKKITDSTDATYMYFIGEYSDDYGISDVRFHFKVNKHDEAATDSFGQERLQFKNNATLGRFSHFTNTELYSLQPGDLLEFYFEVFDNDGVHGAKSARSQVFTYKKPTIREYKEQEEENNEEIKDELTKAIDKVQDFAKEVEAMKEKALEKKNLNWEDKKKLEDLLKQHNELNKSLEQMQKAFEENKKQQEEFKEVDEEILKKQEMIEELMEELLTDEMKAMMEELQKMMEDMEMDQMFEELEDMELSNEDLEEKLDRMLELFKKMEFEQKMEDIANDLEKLAEEQLELSEESKDPKSDSEDLLEKQEEINEEFEAIKEDMEELNEMNEEQKSPADLEEVNEESEEITEDLEKSEEELQKDQPKKASPSQKGAGQKMQKMAQSMKSMMSEMMEMQASEDYENLRQLLENLVKLSFDQELLFETVKKTEVDQPKFRELVQEQYKLKDDAAMIEDSLVALSKRVFQIESFVTEELHKMNREIRQSIDNMEERKKGKAVTNQQFAMTSANNLALMLSEVMEQMQEVMAQSMPGNQQCQKPGGKGKGQLPSLQQMQQQLNKDMKDMKDGMSKGKGPGGKEMSKEFARMAAEQAAMREALRKMKDSMSEG